MSFAALSLGAFDFLADYNGAGPVALQHSLAIYLFSWALFTFFMLIASHRTTLVLVALFFNLTLTFVLLAIGQWAPSVNCTQAGGAWGILTACIAFYAAIAGMLTRTHSVFLLPLGDMTPIWTKYFPNILPPDAVVAQTAVVDPYAVQKKQPVIHGTDPTVIV
jgi:succinate-acetate transporter protein